MDAGHFISCGHQATRYEETNVHIQCTHCNRYLSGNVVAYERNLIDLYGQIHVDHLKSMSQVTVHRKAEDLLTLAKYYNGLIKELEK